MFFKKINIERYKELINEIILNKDIKKEIIEKINYFNLYGEIVLDGYNLYAKCKKSKDFLELKYENKYFLCNYTEWDFAKFITISERDLKNKFIKLERKEKVEYKSDDESKNSTKIEEIEEIYSSDKNKVYESKFTNDIEFKTFKKSIQYIDNHYFTNYFNLDKKWYISNGSIINYKLAKSIMNDNSKLEESYSICPEVYSDGFGTYYNFVDLDENLFKQFMSGNITISEVLDNIDKEEFHKMLVKNISNVDYI